MQGWGMLRNEFSDCWREITMLGFGILFIAHSKEKPTEMIIKPEIWFSENFV